MFERFIVKGRAVVFLSPWLVLAACSGDGDSDDTKDPAGDGDGDSSEPVCESNEDCSDNVFCNGEERCNPDHDDADSFGCIVAAEEPCSEGSTCSESADECGCEEPDADGDNHDSVMCGGDDCDDDDANRFPGNTEVCDTDHHDEDCDAETFGFRDEDNDDDPDDQCCNEDESGDLLCGTDCNDNNGNQHYLNSEVCDDIDNDCDGLVDESPEGDEDDGLKQVFTVDLDGDNFGSAAEDADTAFACVAPEGYVLSNTDCDDSESEVHPAAVDTCNDDIDNDCSGEVNDPPGGCDCEGNETQSCAVGGWVGKCATFEQQCNDGQWDPCPLAVDGETEVCDGAGVDEDCDGAVDELPGAMMPDFGLRTACYVDQDGDGFAATASGSQLLCTCGNNLTSVEPTNDDNTDCDDNTDARAPDNDEVCDSVDNDCDDVPDNNPTNPNTYYADADGDGFGNPNSTVLACTLPEDYAASGNDCNDSTAAIATIASCAPGSRPANTSYQCNSGSCDVTACPANLDDCNADFSDNCETNTTTSRVHCGGCTNGNGVGDEGETCYHACQSSDCDEIVQVVAGEAHSCAVRQSGRVACWGANDVGQLGDQGSTSRSDPGLVFNLTGADAIASGGNHTCVITSLSGGGPIHCWGANTVGTGGRRLGGTSTATSVHQPQQVSGIDNAVALAMGPDHSCAVRANGTVWCWGLNNDGQLGMGLNTGARIDTDQPLAVSVSGISTAVLVATGNKHTCAVLSGGEIYCWGSNQFGQLGDGVANHLGTNGPCTSGGAGHDCTSVPTQVSTISDATSIAAAGDHTCVVRGATDEVYCWGKNSAGQIGTGSATPTSHNQPQKAGALSEIAQIDAGANHVCALTSGGAIWCWGAKSSGQLGNSAYDEMDPVPTPTPATVTGVSDATHIGTGHNHTCAAQSTFVTLCWGSNDDEQLGNDAASPSFISTIVDPAL